MPIIDEKNAEKAAEVTIESKDSSLEVIDKISERKLIMKIDWRLLPILCLLLMAAFLHRINIGNARIMGLEKDLHMRGNDFNAALLVFFVPYILLELPSNILMKRIRPSMWLSGLIFGWGRSYTSSPTFEFTKRSIRHYHNLSGAYTKLCRKLCRPCCLSCLDWRIRGWFLSW